MFPSQLARARSVGTNITRNASRRHGDGFRMIFFLIRDFYKEARGFPHFPGSRIRICQISSRVRFTPRRLAAASDWIILTPFAVNGLARARSDWSKSAVRGRYVHIIPIYTPIERPLSLSLYIYLLHSSTHNENKECLSSVFGERTRLLRSVHLPAPFALRHDVATDLSW